jgi:hypothetical protein
LRSAICAPVMVVTNAYGRVGPPSSLLRGFDAVPGLSVTTLEYDGGRGPLIQHLGPWWHPLLTQTFGWPSSTGARPCSEYHRRVRREAGLYFGRRAGRPTVTVSIAKTVGGNLGTLLASCELLGV